MCFVGIVATGFWKRKEKRTRKGYIEEKENGQCFGDCRHRAKDRKADTLRKKNMYSQIGYTEKGMEENVIASALNPDGIPMSFARIYIYIYKAEVERR